ncbi:hypothetical protein AB395_0000103 [Sinorhizobium fredii CCBAU 45436]|nr:hypothetical protein AB395_0000103 [Sinorhizobium fredii CCBAU 45436]
MSQTQLQKPTITTDAAPAPFADFAPPIRTQSTLRQAITAAYRRPETECLPPLVEAATLPRGTRDAAAGTARKLVAALRAKHKGSGVEGLVQEYSLSSQEGVALMCLAEALLRIPDTATRDALIRDKISEGNWKSHLGGGRSLFVNAATWGLVVTGKLTSTVNDRSLAAALTRLISRCGEPVIRRGVDMAMRMMGEQFVTGETIDEALRRSRALEQKGFRYSYDMLGEAATTAADAERYYKDYEAAIHAIGKASAGRGIYEGPGISIKLSALHPRYTRAQASRVMDELLPKVKSLALLAKKYDIGFNIDAEEADRLELSLDLLEELCLDADLADWNGMGFVVQAYGKRCPFVLDFLIDLARRAAGASWSGSSRAPIGTPKSSGRNSTGSRISRSSPARSIQTFPTSPAPASCFRRRMRFSRNSPRTTPRRSPPSTTWPARTFTSASTSSSACTAWASRSMKRWSDGRISAGPAASMRRSARTKHCLPISSAACSRTAPTPPSCIASPIRAFRSTS